MIFLSALRRRRDAAIDSERFPWTLPLVRDLETLAFNTPVTFLAGENGSGKSSLLEGIAAGMAGIAAGAPDLKRDPTLQAARDLGPLSVRPPSPRARAAVSARRGRVRLHRPPGRG
jgi:predicted ATPase